jgi:superfamily II DNA/RNA helicase
MRPRALVVTLNKELALQTKNVGKGLTHFCKLKCEGLNLGKTMH